MLKNTVTGSLLARILPATVAKHFLENASQDEVNKAEQEAAVLHQQMQAGTPPAEGVTPAAAPTAQAPATGQQETAAPAGNATDLASQLTAMTTRATNAEARATTAESNINTLTGQLATANSELGRYKGWYEKVQGKGTALPTADASNRGQAAQTDQTLSTASAGALAAFQKRKSLN